MRILFLVLFVIVVIVRITGTASLESTASDPEWRDGGNAVDPTKTAGTTAGSTLETSSGADEPVRMSLNLSSNCTTPDCQRPPKAPLAGLPFAVRFRARYSFLRRVGKPHVRTRHAQDIMKSMDLFMLRLQKLYNRLRLHESKQLLSVNVKKRHVGIEGEPEIVETKVDVDRFPLDNKDSLPSEDRAKGLKHISREKTSDEWDSKKSDVSGMKGNKIGETSISLKERFTSVVLHKDSAPFIKSYELGKTYHVPIFENNTKHGSLKVERNDSNNLIDISSFAKPSQNEKVTENTSVKPEKDEMKNITVTAVEKMDGTGKSSSDRPAVAGKPLNSIILLLNLDEYVPEKRTSVDPDHLSDPPPDPTTDEPAMETATVTATAAGDAGEGDPQIPVGDMGSARRNVRSSGAGDGSGHVHYALEAKHAILVRAAQARLHVAMCAVGVVLLALLMLVWPLSRRVAFGLWHARAAARRGGAGGGDGGDDVELLATDGELSLAERVKQGAYTGWTRVARACSPVLGGGLPATHVVVPRAALSRFRSALAVAARRQRSRDGCPLVTPDDGAPASPEPLLSAAPRCDGLCRV